MQVLTRVRREAVAALRAQDEFFWLDLEAPPSHELAALGAELDLHPLAVQDSINFGQRPKVDEFDDHLLIVFYSVTAAPADSGREFEPLEVHVYVSGSFVITIRRRPCSTLDQARQRMQGHPPADEAKVIYRILRALCDAYDRPLKRLERRVDDQEEAVFTAQRNARLEVIYRLHQEVRDLLRRTTAQREQFRYAAQALAELPGLTRGPRAELRDVADHLTEIDSELSRHDVDIDSLVNVYFNVTASQTNTVATRLSLIATFFLAWTLVTGFFGQNFGWLVENIESREAFLVYGVGGLIVATAVAALVLWLGRNVRGDK